MIDAVDTPQFNRWRTPVITVLIYGVCGPPLGVIVLMITVVVSFGFTAPSHPMDISGAIPRLPPLMQMLLLAMPFSYIIGGIQAFASGVMVAAYGMRIATPGYLVAAIASLITYVGFVILGPHRDIWEYGMMVFVHVIPALVCWHIAKRFWIDP